MEREEDCEWALGINQFCLDSIGLWPHEGESALLTFLRHQRVLLIIGIMAAMIVLPEAYALPQIMSHLPLVIDNISTSSVAWIGIVKLYLLWKNKGALCTVMQEAVCDWSTEKTSWERSIMRKQAGRARIFTISGLSMIMLCDVGFAVLPFLGFSVHILNNITDPGMDRGRYFPIQVSFPFDAISFPTFEILYFFLVIAMFGNGIAFTLPENLFGALVFHASGQFEILGAKMQHLFDGIEGTGNDDKILFQRRLRQIVNAHVRLIRLMKITENTFNMVILSQILGLTISTCGFGFVTLDTLSNPDVEISVVRLFLTAGATLSLMFQILIYCIASEVFAHHAQSCTGQLYFSNWYTKSTDYSREIVPIMLCSEIPLRLTAGGFVELSMNLYLRVCKSIFTYISVLLACSEKSIEAS